MGFEIEGTPRVVKARAKCKVPGVLDAFASVLTKLQQNPRYVVPDKPQIWKKEFPDLPNHRHDDLPDGWRVSWSVIRQGQTDSVLVVFLGSHKDYENTYGFTGH